MALQRDIPTEPTQLAELRSLMLKLGSSKLEPKKIALQQIAFQLQDKLYLFGKAKHAHDSTQRSLDWLTNLQIEKKAYAASYLQLDAKRKKTLAEDKATKKRIKEINNELSQLQKELKTLLPQHDRATQ